MSIFDPFTQAPAAPTFPTPDTSDISHLTFISDPFTDTGRHHWRRADQPSSQLLDNLYAAWYLTQRTSEGKHRAS